MIRLADDRVPATFYVEKAIQRRVPLFMGVGATQIDRHSIVDFQAACDDITTTTKQHIDAVRTVAQEIAKNGYDSLVPPWPGAVYFEDVSAESSFPLIEAIVEIVLNEGSL